MIHKQWNRIRIRGLFVDEVSGQAFYFSREMLKPDDLVSTF